MKEIELNLSMGKFSSDRKHMEKISGKLHLHVLCLYCKLFSLLSEGIINS